MPADGSVIFDTKLDTKDFKIGAQQLSKAVKALEQSANRSSAGMAKSARGYGAAMRIA